MEKLSFEEKPVVRIICDRSQMICPTSIVLCQKIIGPCVSVDRLWKDGII
jgi:hypothetical protein